MANYSRELRIGIDIRKKEKVKSVAKFVERMRKVQKKAEIVLRKAQKEIKKQTDKRQREVEVQNKNNKMMLSTKNLVFKERLVKKLTEKYIGLYVVKNVMSSIKEYSKVKAACQDR